jgi:hypothetical protein
LFATLPVCNAASYPEERTYEGLLGPLGQERSVWAECLFVDPVSDIAVLGAPSHDDLREQSAAYEALVMGSRPLRIADAPEKTSAQLLVRPGEANGVRAFGLTSMLLYSCSDLDQNEEVVP